ncbi:hypothetical protein PGT21_035943 [Puccinia graminis f. sp. tritici]|uniref:Secreted protein n=1 Tax=Puccinia graminis f. sp. tritici TaxID=56615 RepID=A0A5B0R314_PUCGR|nr:hypothetical protein PGT21_035943 [Puccinia graminis f. sp. tritici]
MRMFLKHFLHNALLVSFTVIVLSRFPTSLASTTKSGPPVSARCGIHMYHGDPGFFNCMTDEHQEFSCADDSCEHAGYGWKDFMFKQCQAYNPDNTLSQTYQDIYVDTFLAFNADLWVEAQEKKTAKSFVCGWTEHGPDKRFNARRPTCHKCRLIIPDQ